MSTPSNNKQAKAFHDSAKEVSRRLASVATIFRDEDYVQLLRENAYLKSVNLWHALGSDKLQATIDKSTNLSRLSPVCDCFFCYNAHRYDPKVVYPEEIGEIFRTPKEGDAPRPCVVLKCLLHHAQKLGLVVMTVDLTVPETQFLHLFEEHNCHLIIFSDSESWWVGYGMKLQFKNFHLNPDTDLVGRLISLVRTDEFFIINGLHYADLSHRRGV